MNKKKHSKPSATIIKYTLITVIGILLFNAANQAANADRITDSVGGEGLLLFLPIIWWLIERTIKDLISENQKSHKDEKHRAYEEVSK